MGLARPVVAPRTGGIPEIISNGEDGFLVEGRTPEKFARPCLELMKNQKLRITVGDKASEKIAAEFSSSRMAADYRELYTQSCVGEASEPRISRVVN